MPTDFFREMDMSKFTITLFTLLTIFTISACGSAPEGTNQDTTILAQPDAIVETEETPEAQLALAFEGIQEVSSRIFGALKAVFSCELFDRFIFPMDAEFLCPAGGTFRFSVAETSCQEDPLEASVALTLEFDSCTFWQVPLDGLTDIGIALDETTIAASVSTDLTTVGEVPFTISDVSVTVDFDGTANCSGTLLVWDVSCEMDPACQGCTLSHE